ncbi:MAG: isoleucine--tRNA ligase [Puniceicoccales bacterium]|nr:isoleucine--tRNA ligase [Puniceicoccales bacterium]
MEQKDTLNLPQTDFPLRANAQSSEAARIRHWAEIDLYRQIQNWRSTANKRFVLHDGPPFTNGDVHIGTALNKVLKDILIRYKSMGGFSTPYVPGWDCHGLPIELKVLKDMHGKEKNLTVPELRARCSNFSREYSKVQRRQFERLGLLADWASEYRTMDPAYEASIIDFFAKCVDEGFVYCSKKPVYWSIPCKTALAEAEVEYKEHCSLSVWVKFPLDGAAAEKLNFSRPSHVVIWTTTPWTLPSNLAIAVNGAFFYVPVECNGEIYVVEATLADRLISDCSMDNARVGMAFSGNELVGLSARHPFIGRESKLLEASFVTNDAGTGCVHIAPGHGMEDYVLGIKNGLEAYSPIDDESCYVDDGQIPAELVGVAILDGDGKCPANGAVVNILRKNNRLLGQRVFQHSYPHCWRSKTPVIFRAMSQWFIALDHNGLRQRVLDAVEQVQWIPAWGKNRIRGAIEARPDWCISRQRSWGTPMPLFFDEDGRPLLDGNVIRAIGEKIRKLGSDCWFQQSPEELLHGIALPDSWQGKRLFKGTDTLDVWIDSGCSSKAVLRERSDLAFPADIYVEGSDQHRGWFQSSLWCSVIDCGAAPYRTILTHGFIVGEDKKKISKSDGKPQTADDYIRTYGADVVRLWISSEDFRNDIPISDGILQHVVSAYGTLRNTLRYQLGNLYDFDEKSDAIPMEKMLPVDRWALDQARQLIGEVGDAYEKCEFHRIYRAVLNFCTVTLSATYHDILKDRLYTYAADGLERKSAQTAMCKILLTLIRLLLPIIPFTADEAYAHLQCNCAFAPHSAHLLDWPNAEHFQGNESVAADVDRLLAVRSTVYRQLEIMRQKKIIGKSLEARVRIRLGNGTGEVEKLLRRYGDDLAELFIVSQVSLETGGDDEISVEVEKAQGKRCDRCWRWVTDGAEVNQNHLCPRCVAVIANGHFQK